MRKFITSALVTATLIAGAPAASAAQGTDGKFHFSTELSTDYEIAFANLSFEHGFVEAITALFKLPVMPLSTWFRNETASPARPIAWD